MIHRKFQSRARQARSVASQDVIKRKGSKEKAQVSILAIFISSRSEIFPGGQENGGLSSQSVDWEAFASKA